MNSTPMKSPQSRLDTFVAPMPNPLLMRAVTPLVSVACLSGIPLLRDLPWIGGVPGIRGLSNVIEIDLPRDDALRLRAAVNPGTAAFIAPNHPEFFTDWMLDKALTARIAPDCACWATNHIVNGLGPIVQGFWLRNGLIAQVPGAGAQGKSWSVDWALKGNGILLHPEGDVGWHGDRLAPLFGGVIDMAVAAALKARAEGQLRPAMVVPVVWKLNFVRSVEHALLQEIGYIERRLSLDAGRGTPAERVATLYDLLLRRDEAAMGNSLAGIERFEIRQRTLLTALGRQLVAALPEAGLVLPSSESEGDPAVDWLPVLRLAERQARRSGASSEAVKSLLKTLRRVLRFRPSLYPTDQITQEHVAENVKRIRHDYCAGTTRDTVNRFVPQPVGPRIASIRAPEPIDIGAVLGQRDALPEAENDAILAELARRMQASLDALAATSVADSEAVYDNPWR